MSIEDITQRMIASDETPEGIEPVEDEFSNFLTKYHWYDLNIDNDWLDMTIPLEKPKYLLSIGDAYFSMITGVMCITGQAGHGKTGTTSLLVSAMLGNNVEFGNLKYNMRESIPNPKVIYIDTEQPEYYTKLFYHRVCAMVGWNREENNERFRVANLREYPDTKERWARIIRMIHKERPTVVIVDGLLDVVDNQNDIDECNPRVGECLAIATKFNLSFWTIIHQNPGKTDKMSGILGSAMERKADDVFCTTKSKDEAASEVTFEVQQLKARGKDVDKWWFKIDYDHDKHIALPKPFFKQVDTKPTPIQQTPEERETELLNKFRKLDILANGISQTEFAKKLGFSGNDLSRSKHWKDISEAIGKGILERVKMGNRTLYYFREKTRGNQPTQAEIQYPEAATPTPPPPPEPVPPSNAEPTTREAATLPIVTAAPQQSTESNNPLPFPEPDGTAAPF